MRLEAYHSNDRWPHMKDRAPEVVIGLRHESDAEKCSGSDCGEATIEWVDLGNYGRSPRLRIFGDGLPLAYALGDVLAAMARNADKEPPNPASLIARLVERGWTDATREQATT